MEIDYDFNGSLTLSSVVEDFFYSPETGLYVSRHPLVADRRVLKAADELNIRVQASPEKWLVNTELSDCLCILAHLGSQALSLPEYFKVRNEAAACADKSALLSLESGQFIEMLATIFIHDRCMIHHLTSSAYLETLDGIIEKKEILVEHPHIEKSAKGYSYRDGIRKKVNILEGKPGLIDIGKIDPSTGLPTEVEDPRQYGTGLWRYWSPDSGCAWVLRSTIFAYDMPALDLKFDFPESLPRLAIRPCTASVIHPHVGVYEEEGKIRVMISD